MSQAFSDAPLFGFKNPAILVQFLDTSFPWKKCDYSAATNPKVPQGKMTQCYKKILSENVLTPCFEILFQLNAAFPSNNKELWVIV